MDSYTIDRNDFELDARQERIERLRLLREKARSLVAGEPETVQEIMSQIGRGAFSDVPLLTYLLVDAMIDERLEKFASYRIHDSGVR